jgi:hypothetical protein
MDARAKLFGPMTVLGEDGDLGSVVLREAGNDVAENRGLRTVTARIKLLR